MDFLKSCATGVQTLPGFNSIHYHVYSVELKDGSAEEGSLEETLCSLASELRAARYLIHTDSARHALWIFRSSGHSGFAHVPLDEASQKPRRKDTNLKSLFQGTLKATELTQCFNRAPIPNNNPTAGPPNVPTATLRAAQLASLRAFHQAAGAPGTPQEPAAFPLMTDVRTIYSLFMSAVMATISYHFARHHRILQLDSKTFLKTPLLNPDMEDKRNLLAPLCPFVLDVYLTTGGTMVISSAVNHQYRLHALRASTSSVVDQSTLVYLAIGGMSALLVQDTYPPDDADTLAWKGLIEDHLALKGLLLHELDPQMRWVLVRAWPEINHKETSGDVVAFTGVTFYWPASLCFLNSEINHEQENKSQDMEYPRSSWLSSPDDGGYIDPLQFAEDWFLGKPERDRIIEERRRNQKETEAAQAHAESAALNVASPFYTRGDLQLSSGVYPTPPDGLPSQAASATITEIPIASIVANGQIVFTSGDYSTDTMDLDMGVFGENARLRDSSLISGASMQLDSTGLEDDLIGDLDEDEFVGNDITDADFSFFDEPDLEETDVTEPFSAVDIPEDDGVDDPQISTLSAKSVLNASTEFISSDNMQAAVVAGTETCKEDLEHSAQDLNGIECQTPIHGSTPLAKDLTTGSRHSPSSIRKKLFEVVLHENQDPLHCRRQSNFEPVLFGADLEKTDAKYTSNGTFSFQLPANTSNLKRPPANSSPSFSISLPPRKKRPRDTQSRFPGEKRMVVTKFRRSCSNAGSVTSDASDSDSQIGPLASPVKSLYQDERLWDLQDEQIMSAATSPSNYIIAEDENSLGMGGSKKDRLDLLIAIFNPIHDQKPFLLSSSHKLRSEQVLPLNASPTGPLMSSLHALDPDSPLLPSHKDFISVAQLVAEQLIFGSNDLMESYHNQSSDLHAFTLYDIEASSIHTAQSAITSLLDGSTNCDLLKFVCVQDHVVEKPMAKGNPSSARKTGSVQTQDGVLIPANLFTSLPPPHVRVRRNEGLWDILPPAIFFWEHLGLAPTNGSKNVMAFCLYPSNDSLRVQASLFLDSLCSTYESNRLGCHIRQEQLGKVLDGLVPIPIEGRRTAQDIIRSMQEVCANLGNDLASVDWQSAKAAGSEETIQIDNFVIYIINPFDAPSYISELCSAFWCLYQAYGQAYGSPSQQSSRPDIVLQILPIKHVASSAVPVIPEPAFFQKLAREVYDRCPPALPDTSLSALKIPSAASIQLEQSPLKTIQFKLASEPPLDLMHENSHFHLGYAKSANGEWISAAWTDNAGKYQATVSYCIVGRTFFEIAREMWGASVDIMLGRRVVWRFSIARVGMMEREELDAWASLSTSASQLTIITVITSINGDASLSVFPKPTPQIPSSTHAPACTSVDTPQPGVSPDTTHALTPAATPSAGPETNFDLSNDPDAHLIDVGDETWGLILAHRTNVSGSPTDYRPSLSTGFLLKKNAGPITPLDTEDDERLKGSLLCAINLLWIGSSPRNPSNNGISNSRSSTNQQQQVPLNPSSTDAPSSAQPHGPTATPASFAGGGNIPKYTADGILRDYLGMYRALGVLARVRGLRGSRKGLLPWHYVVAKRGVEGLQEAYAELDVA